MESASPSWPHLIVLAISGQRGFAPHDWVYLIALLLTLLLAGTAAAAETALTSVNRIRIRNLADEGDKSAKRIEQLLHKPHLFITTILVISNLAVITASTLATLIALDLNFNGAEVLSTIILSLVVLIFCEITPKTAAVRAPEAWSRWLVGPVDSLMRVLLPLVMLLTFISNAIMRIFGGNPSAMAPFVTEDELRLMVEVSEEEGVLEEEAREMIDNVFELNDKTVREVMVPRIDMVAIEADSAVEEATQLVLQGGNSRVPVYDDTIDEIVGLLYAKDLLRVLATGQKPASVRTLVRKAYFVPETKRLDDLLRELRKQRVHMAIVVDEYGAVAGLVTIEDLVEEIIGDIKDEYDVEEQLFERVGENEYLINAKLSVSEFGDLIGHELPGGEYDTVGGFVYTQLDKIPTIGDVVTFEDLTFTVLDTKGRRVTKVKVVRQPPPEEGEEAAVVQPQDENRTMEAKMPQGASEKESGRRTPTNGIRSKSDEPRELDQLDDSGSRMPNGRGSKAQRG